MDQLPGRMVSGAALVWGRFTTQEPLVSSFGQRIRPAIQSELDAARRARAAHDASAEFASLERAHVLSQADSLQHVGIHAAMLLWGLRQRSAREVFGQMVRIIGAATKTTIGLVPHGNTGGSNAGPWRRMPIAPDLQRLIDAAGGHPPHFRAPRSRRGAPGSAR